MIPVIPQPEPATFSADVRAPGKKYLARTPRPTSKGWRSHSYWTACIPDIYRAYGGICSFACHWIPRDTGSITVEHYKPKSLFPKLAYEWANFRLMCGSLNGRKKDYLDVLDPFAVENGMFVIDFPSLLIKPAPALPITKRKKVEKTINRLRLNDEGTCLHGRNDWLRPYCLNQFPFAFLKTKAPFLASELERQGLVESIKVMMPYNSPTTLPVRRT